MFFSSSAQSKPLLGGGKDLREENEKLKNELSLLAYRIRTVNDENKRLRAENERLMKICHLRETKGKKKKKDSPKLKAENEKESEFKADSYQLTISTSSSLEENQKKIMEDGMGGKRCYQCGTTQYVHAQCSASNCERYLCTRHSHKMLTNAELFCEDCYANWSNVVPTELSIIVKKVYNMVY
mmetsp:Transcript_24488/g.36724  ORF Transcript_24488/g.36724 Transcript_24488/m.36724 type:complete len:183 (+) Transcript_24488:58-606(+)